MVTVSAETAPDPASTTHDFGLAQQEAALVRRARDGDADALDQLLAPYLVRAWRVSRRMMSSDADAEDLVQDAVVRCIEQLDRFTPGRPFGAWFMQLLTNLGLNSLKAARVRSAEPLLEEAHDAGADPYRDAVAAEIRERFQSALEELPPRQRVIVYMFDVDGYTGAEIASALNISADTVRWHLHTARATLRTRLADLRPIPGEEESPNDK